MRRLLGLAKRAAEKPPWVVAYRLQQAVRVAALRHTGGFRRLAARVAAAVRPERAPPEPALIAPDAAAAAARWRAANPTRADAALAHAEAVLAGRVEVFGAAVPRDRPGGDWPWNRDWRTGFEWAPGFFHDFDFYTRDDSGGVFTDVKIPWELQRLGCFLPAGVAPLLGGDPAAAARFLEDTLASWEAANPCGYSIGWLPMEASMRAVALAQLAEVTGAWGAPAALRGRVARLLALHAEFVWRTLEYTDVNGNHYAANLAALVLAGAVLGDAHPPSRGYGAAAWRWLQAEILGQFHPDGVQFEASIPYHRLVAELALLAAIAADRRGLGVSDAARARLAAALGYTRAYRRPDGLAPLLGDCDDGLALQFEPRALQDHAALADLGAAWLGDETLREGTGPGTLEAALFCGGSAAGRPPAPPRPAGHRYFPDAGVVVGYSGESGHYFLADVGPVGLAGRGGHGHNDLLSFEVCAAGTPLIVDIGSFMYTGAPEWRDYYRSSAGHNGLVLDGEEIAPFAGFWRIRPDAAPEAVAVARDRAGLTVRASHTGYRRLTPPAEHRRELAWDPGAGALRCVDQVACGGPRRVRRHLHFAAGVGLEVGDGAAAAVKDGRRWTLRWDRASAARVLDGWVSGGYARRREAATLCLESEAAADAEFWFELGPDAGAVAA